LVTNSYTQGYNECNRSVRSLDPHDSTKPSHPFNDLLHVM